MGQMSNEEAARILDPETSREALAPYAHDCQLRLAVTEEACTVAAKVLRQTAWISVKDRLPSDRGDVLVVAFWHERWGVYMGWCAHERAKWSVHVGLGERSDVTVSHWMPLPLPEPPKED